MDMHLSHSSVKALLPCSLHPNRSRAWPVSLTQKPARYRSQDMSQGPNVSLFCCTVAGAGQGALETRPHVSTQDLLGCECGTLEAAATQIIEDQPSCTGFCRFSVVTPEILAEVEVLHLL